MHQNPTALALSIFSLLVAFLGNQPLCSQERGSPLELARQLNQAFIDVADKISPAVVVIRVAHDPAAMNMDDEQLEALPPQFRKWLEDYRDRHRPEKDSDKDQDSNSEPEWDGQGSGVIIREDGYILTNRHVVERAKKIKVRFKDLSECDGEIRGVDVQSDLAVVKIDPKGRKLATAKLANSDKTRVGEFAIAIGAPFDLDYSVTFGHVSAKARSRIIPDEKMDQDFIQTDANINPGNSGGPLVNIDGEIIGINTLIHGMRTGIGFAIPANLAREVSDRLISEGKFVRAYLGVKIRSLREHHEIQEHVPGIADGVVVQEILRSGSAYKSDLKAGDIIIAVDGKPVTTPQQLKNEIRGKAVGEPITLEVHRFGENLRVQIKPEPWPEDPPILAAANRSGPSNDRASNLGLTVQARTKELAKEYGLEKEKIDGVIVTEVASDSEAERKRIKPGAVITEVNKKHVASPAQFLEALKAANLKKGVRLSFTQDGTSRMEILKDSGD
jgi:serine protease Do